MAAIASPNKPRVRPREDDFEAHLMENVTGRIQNLEQVTHRIEDKVDENSRETNRKLDSIGQSMLILTRMEERMVNINDRLSDGARSMGQTREIVEKLGARVTVVEGEVSQLKELRVTIHRIGFLVISAVIAGVLTLVIRS
jgi:methyl-accepting chemotaxis protein